MGSNQVSWLQPTDRTLLLYATLSCLLQKGFLSFQRQQSVAPTAVAQHLASCNSARFDCSGYTVQDTTRNQLLKANLAITFLNLALCYGNVVIVS